MELAKPLLGDRREQAVLGCEVAVRRGLSHAHAAGGLAQREPIGTAVAVEGRVDERPPEIAAVRLRQRRFRFRAGFFGSGGGGFPAARIGSVSGA